MGSLLFPGLAAGDIKEGDYFTIKVPDGLSLKDATLDLIDTSSNKVLGKVVADSVTGVITFTFSKEVEDKQNVKGTFTVASNATTTGTENTVTYNLPGVHKPLPLNLIKMKMPLMLKVRLSTKVVGRTVRLIM